MTRSELQKFARTKVKEGRILLRGDGYDGAYYLLGFSVELALKACIAKKTKKYDFPEKVMVDKSWRHELRLLTSVAGLDQIIDAESRNSPAFAANWNVVLQWSNDSRYATHTAQETEDLYKAITERRNGVMACIRRFW